MTELGQELIQAANEAREIARTGRPVWSNLSFFKTQYPVIKKFIQEEVSKGKSILPNPGPGDLAERADGWRGPAMFNAFIRTPRDKVKVVILGQDPYPNKRHAMGLAFGVPYDVTPLPPTLVNIMLELANDIGSIKTDQTLTSWAKQGVLLLNTSLTVEEGKSNSHQYIGWKELTQEVLETLSAENDGLVFILWGSFAQGYKQYIKNPEKHMILQSSHPSPLSADRGFFGSKPFSKTNFFLESVGKSPIKW